MPALAHSPRLKAALPHVAEHRCGNYRRRSRAKTRPDQNVLQQQITELQSAATTNDAHIKELAAQIKNTVELLPRSPKSRHQRLLAFCIGTTVLSLLALGIADFRARCAIKVANAAYSSHLQLRGQPGTLFRAAAAPVARKLQVAAAHGLSVRRARAAPSQ